MNTTPLIKHSLILPIVLLFAVLSSTATMGQFPDSDVSPFKEETGAFSELDDGGADEDLGSARARARARARRRSGRDSDSEDRRTIRPRSEEFEDEDPFRRPTDCLLYTSPSPRDQRGSRMPSSA